MVMLIICTGALGHRGAVGPRGFSGVPGLCQHEWACPSQLLCQVVRIKGPSWSYWPKWRQRFGWSKRVPRSKWSARPRRRQRQRWAHWCSGPGWIARCHWPKRFSWSSRYVVVSTVFRGFFFASAVALTPNAGAPSIPQEGTTSGLFARWYHMKLQHLPAESSFESAMPARLTTVPNLNFQSTDDAFANSGMKTDYAARFEGYPHQVA